MVYFLHAPKPSVASNAAHSIQNSLDAILKNNTWIDSNRVCACGASYGGFMMNWLNSQTKGTYKCLVTHEYVFARICFCDLASNSKL
jgi:uncharacterized protein YjaZ